MTLSEKFLKTSLIYFVVGVTMGALLTVKPIHDSAINRLYSRGAFTYQSDWMVSMAIIGGIYLLIKDKPLYSKKLGTAGFWLLNAGISVMFILMLIADISGQPFQ